MKGWQQGGRGAPRSACAQLCLPASLMNINEQKEVVVWGGKLICLILRWLPQ